MSKYNTRQKYGMGWFKESERHSLARRGIKTGRKSSALQVNLCKVDYSAEDTLKHEWLNDKSAVEAYELNNTVIRIYPDDTAESPDEWKNDNLFLVHYHRDFEVERDDIITKDDARNLYQGNKIPQEKDYWIFPVDAYIHGGVSLTMLGGFHGRLPQGHEQFDVSSVGLILASKKEFKSMVEAEKSAKGLLENWNTYLLGDVYGFDVSDPKTGESIDSCWGFYGKDEAKKEAENSAKSYDPAKRHLLKGQRKVTEYSKEETDMRKNVMSVRPAPYDLPNELLPKSVIDKEVKRRMKIRRSKINYMMGASYSTKKELKENIGKPLRYVETSLFGSEYKDDGEFVVVGPDAYTNRKWYAKVTMKDGLIEKVK